MSKKRWRQACLLASLLFVSLMVTELAQAWSFTGKQEIKYNSIGEGIPGIAAGRCEETKDRAGYSAWINIVEDYQADNTGEKNISALVNRAMTENPGATIYFPEGDYKISKPITYVRPGNEEVYNDQIRMGCALRGAGKGRSVLHLSTGENKDAISFVNGDSVRISDMTFVNENIENRNMILVEEHAWDFTLEDCDFYNCVEGICIENGGYSYIRNCAFYASDDACSYMILQSFDKETAVADTNEYAYVEDCTFEGKATAAIRLEALKYGSVAGCTFMNNSGSGIRLTSETGDCFNHTLDANVFVNMGTGIYLNPTNYYMSRVSVSNSYFEKVENILRLKKGDCNYDGDLEFYGCTVADSNLITTNAELRGYFELYEESSKGLDSTTSYTSRKKMPIRLMVLDESVKDMTEVMEIETSSAEDSQPNYLIMDSEGRELREGEDYIRYRSSTDTCTLVGVGSYTGLLTLPWVEEEEELLPVYNLVECGGDNLGYEDVSSLINDILLQNRKEKYILYIPRGKYRLDAPLLVDNTGGQGVILMGEGKDKTFFQINYDAMAGESPIQVNHGQNVVLQGFQLLPMDISTEANAQAPMIHVWDGQNICIEDICIYSMLADTLGLYVDHGQEARIFQCNFNRLQESETGLNGMVLLSGGRRNEVFDCTFEGKYSTADGSGLILQYEDGTLIRNTDFCNWYGGDAILIRQGAYILINNTVFMRNKTSIRQIGQASSVHMRNISVWTGDLPGNKYIFKSEGDGMEEVLILGLFLSSNKAKIEAKAVKSQMRSYLWYDTKLNSDVEDSAARDKSFCVRWIKGKKTSYKLKPDNAGDYKLQIFNCRGELLKKGKDYSLKKKEGYWLLKGKGDYSGILYLKYSK